MLIKVPFTVLFLEIFSLFFWNFDADEYDLIYLITLGVSFLIAAIIFYYYFKCMGPRVSTMITMVLSYYAFVLFLIILLIEIDKVFDNMELFLQAISGIILVIDICGEFIMMCIRHKKNK